MTDIECLLFLLENNKNDKEAQAAYLQAYISICGPIPDRYSEEVRKLLE